MIGLGCMGMSQRFPPFPERRDSISQLRGRRRAMRGSLAFVASLMFLAGTAASAAEADPSGAQTSLAIPNGQIVVPLSEEIEEQTVHLPIPTNGSGTASGLIIDPASPSRAAPAAEVIRNGLLRVLPAANNQHRIPVTYGSITVSFGRTTRTLPVDDPVWRATATGTYLAAVSLHYTWQAATDTGAGKATFWFKLHVPRTHRPAR